MKRKRGGFGSSAEVHREKMSRFAQSAIAASGDTVRAIKRGRCDVAFKHLHDALRAIGVAGAHATAADTTFSRETADNVDTATDTFKRSCVK